MLVAATLMVLVGAAPANRTPRIVCDTTVQVGEGRITIALWPHTAPIGVQRFLDLTNSGFFTQLPLFRAVPRFLCQFGISMNKTRTQEWAAKGAVKDDPPSAVPFTEGIVSFAGYGKNSRTTHLFITLGKRVPHLGKAPWEVPVGRVVSGFDVMRGIYTGYGDQLNQGKLHGPNRSRYLSQFPKLDYFKKCFVEHVP